jgi:gamma-glutamylcyclotransferase (GGCT)/AIG2-like uncharacterized protein YtfP
MKGMENHIPYQDHLEFLGMVKLPGFKMYSMEQYPYVVRSNNADHTIVAELYKVVDAKTEQSIHELELDEGYIFSEVDIADDKFGIYVFDEPVINSVEVVDGDWRSYRKRYRV